MTTGSWPSPIRCSYCPSQLHRSCSTAIGPNIAKVPAGGLEGDRLPRWRSRPRKKSQDFGYEFGSNEIDMNDTGIVAYQIGSNQLYHVCFWSKSATTRVPSFRVHIAPAVPRPSSNP